MDEYHEFVIWSLKNEQRKIQKQVWLRRKVCDNFFKSCLQLKDWFEWKKNKATNTRVKDFIKACKISTIKSSYSEIFSDAIKTFSKTLKILSRNSKKITRAFQTFYSYSKTLYNTSKAFSNNFKIFSKTYSWQKDFRQN